jgi:hypothetical protein
MINLLPIVSHAIWVCKNIASLELSKSQINNDLAPVPIHHRRHSKEKSRPIGNLRGQRTPGKKTSRRQPDSLSSRLTHEDHRVPSSNTGLRGRKMGSGSGIASQSLWKHRIAGNLSWLTNRISSNGAGVISSARLRS